MFEKLKEYRHWLYAQTGIQHQPFNTIYQLLARKEEQPELFAPSLTLPHGFAHGGGNNAPSPVSGATGEGWGGGWLLLPDLFLYLLGGEPGYERSIATTTQLTDSGGEWNPAVFEKFGLAIPALPIIPPNIAGEIDGIRLTRVGGHDTACAVEGMGLSASDEGTVFANIGTWALVGCVKENADHSPTSEAQNWTNERTPWNNIRYLTNIPGFFILNRLHDDLGIKDPMSEWIEAADLSTVLRIDPFAPEFYAPDSMLKSVQSHIERTELSGQSLCGIALLSLVDTIAERVTTLGGKKVVMAGGASNSATLRKLIEVRTGAEITMGAAEATLVGNLRTQFRILEQER
jgi:rhamnulokinase